MFASAPFLPELRSCSKPTERRVYLQVECLEDLTFLSASALPQAPRPEKAVVCNAIRELGGNVSRQASRLQKQLREKAQQLSDQLTKQTQELKKDINGRIQKTRDQFVRLKKQSQKSILGEVQRQLQSVANAKFTAYDISTTGTLDLNFSAGSYFAGLKVGFGVTLDSETLKAFSQGSLQVPDINPMEGAAAALGLKLTESNSYDAIRNTYVNATRGGSTYFASERFVRWAGPRTLAKWSALVATGVGAGPIIREALGQLTLELNDILAWLRLRGVQRAETVAGNMLGQMVLSLFRGSAPNFSLPEFNLRVTPVSVPFQFALQGAGITQAPAQTIRKLESLSGGRFTGAGAFNHLGFAITLDGPTDTSSLYPPGYSSSLSGQSPAVTVQDALDQFDARKNSTNGLLASSLTSILNSALRVVPNSNLRRFLTRIASSSVAGSYTDGLVSGRLMTMLGINRTELQRAFVEGNPIVNLTNSPVARRLAGFLQPLALGNEGSVIVEKLELNLNTYALSMKVTLRHRHSWGTLGEATAAVGRYFNARARQINQEARKLERELSRELKELRQSVKADLRAVERDINDQLDSLCRRASNELAAAAEEARRALEAAGETLANAGNAVGGTLSDARDKVVNVFSGGGRGGLF